MKESAPVSFYSNINLPYQSIITINNNKKLSVETEIKGNIISFVTPDGFDNEKTIIIDPFITNTSILSGYYKGKAKDVDFDFDGNVFVAGGGGGTSTQQIAKYSPGGSLLWTFREVSIPFWNFGQYFGGWVVEKTSGKVFAGTGKNNSGFQIIRINSSGIYDNYISTPNSDFNEDWKMLWNCNNGTPQILVAGGSTAAPVNLAVCTPPFPIISSINLTGIAYPPFQDISDVVIDPHSNDMYCIFASGSVLSINNRMYKIAQPYSSGTVAWNAMSGYYSLNELSNRPYLDYENSSNSLAVNSSFLYYWDGQNLQAYDKGSGNRFGNPLFFSLNRLLFEGGIIADECNNIFIGSANGTIKVLHFDGTNFDDAGVADITLPGISGNVYDLAYDNGRNLLYASGDGFVASIDISGYCPLTTYQLSSITDCSTLTASAELRPYPPQGSTINYYLYDGSNVVASNSNGSFSALNPDVLYTIKAIVDENCSGTQCIGTFKLNPIINAYVTPSNCNKNNGKIILSATGDNGPFTYSFDGSTFNNNNQLSGLHSGLYKVYVKNNKGCISSQDVTVTDISTLNPSINSTDAICGNNSGNISINTNGGNAPYQYALNSGSYQNNSSFSNLAPGNYIITVKDNNGCLTTTRTIVINSIPPTQSSISTKDASCGKSNGTLSINTNQGTTPYEYSIDGTAFQTNSNFNNLAPTTYSVLIKDKNGCVETVATKINNIAPPSISVSVTNASCTKNDGMLSASIAGGASPFAYKINSGPYQNNETFNDLKSGEYQLTVQDANGCTDTKTIKVLLNNTVFVDAGHDLAICEGTSTILSAKSNGSSNYWLPISGLNNPDQLNLTATPSTTTKYYLTATLGVCSKTDSITITVNPAPIANAGKDSVICYGTDAFLNGEGGTVYSWTPSKYFQDAHIASPVVIKPKHNQSYILMVTDAFGCSSLQPDTVTISVTPPTVIFAGNDTILAAGEPIPLYAIDVNNSGFSQYDWSPGTGLNNPYIFNPVATPPHDITYNVTAKTPSGCVGKGQINIKVYEGPQIYVPNAFTPNGDKLNDILKAFPVGIRQFNYFALFNRWGQRIFYTEDQSQGWDGTINGKLQDTAVFVWIAKAIDYNGKILFRKGTVTLIR
ncbi:MAG: gliding motility-associated C-terminal domain-containing protein [Flavisolibacter sp.]